VDNATSQPVSVTERIASLDVLRGVAILGILLMNIVSFGMIISAYDNPLVYGDAEGIDWYVWLCLHIVADNKFMSIFSILFGAGVCIFIERAESKGHSAGALQINRMCWLLIIGLLHSYLIWFGDILVTYALCGLFIAMFRRWKPRNLIVIGILMAIPVPLLFNAFFSWSVQFWPPESIQEMLDSNNLMSEASQVETATYRGDYFGQLGHRATISAMMQFFLFPIYMFWRAAGLMLVGMGCYKLGILSAEKSKSFYIQLLFISLLIGIPVILLGVHYKIMHNFEPIARQFLDSNWNIVGAVFVAFAWLSTVMLLCKSSAMDCLKHAFSAVGRMALTNYLMQSLIGTFIFYGHGLGYYGKLERWEMLLIVSAIWMFQITFSVMWLKRFRFGPFEWLWRCATYFQIQKIRI